MRVFRRTTTSGVSDKNGSMAVSKSKGVHQKCISKFMKIFTGKANASQALDGTADERPIETPVEEILTFKQNLERRRFAEASQQLIAEEARLFTHTQLEVDAPRNKGDEEKMETKNSLAKDYEDFYHLLWLTIEKSLNVTEGEEQKALKEAVQAVIQEEEQDQKWEKCEGQDLPPWRPHKCRQVHDDLLKKMVARRLEEAEPVAIDNSSSSVQKELQRMGKCVKLDLLHVSRRVRYCYPEEENVCQFYARLYHREFRANLLKLTDFWLSDDDCSHLLLWVNKYYPSIFEKEKELEVVIEYDKLEPLLSGEVLNPLEKQYLRHKELTVENWLQKILKREEKVWQEKSVPEMTDGCYFSPLAIDVIQVVSGTLISAKAVLGKASRPHGITNQLRIFLDSYGCYLKKVMKDNQGNTKPLLMAHLSCIKQIRTYIVKASHDFQEDTLMACLSLLTDLRDRGYSYFTSNIHLQLKGKYKKVGTMHWLPECQKVCKDLLEGIETHIQNLCHLDQKCQQELLCRLHMDVVVEYVRRMMKRNLKLKDKAQQDHAAKVLCEDGQKIHTLFTAAGSTMEWLKDILPKLAELLKLQDLHCVELELGALARDYPDLRKQHVSAFLNIKANRSTSDLKTIMKTFSILQDPKFMENNSHVHHQGQSLGITEEDSFQSSRAFFSRVNV